MKGSLKTNKIRKLYQKLRLKHGQPRGQWKLWCKRPKTFTEKEEVIIGAILTQRTNWSNVEAVSAILKKNKRCSLKGIYQLSRKNKEKLVALIRPSGFYRQKAERLFNLAEFVLKTYGSIQKMQRADITELREKFSEIKGLGPETIDSILLYALEKPVFVIDEYTRRLVKRCRLARDFSYQSLQRLFEKNLPRDYCLYQDFHALIIIDEKQLKI